jgi:hypothetical protein
MATYSEKVGSDIPVSTTTMFRNKKKQAVTISTGRGDGTKFQGFLVRVVEFPTLQHDLRRGRG